MLEFGASKHFNECIEEANSKFVAVVKPSITLIQSHSLLRAAQNVHEFLISDRR
jgi:hypothetical protein